MLCMALTRANFNCGLNSNINSPYQLQKYYEQNRILTGNFLSTMLVKLIQKKIVKQQYKAHIMHITIQILESHQNTWKDAFINAFEIKSFIFLSLIYNRMKTQSKLAVGNTLDCKWNEYKLDLNLSTNSEIQMVMVNMENLDYYERKITDEEIKRDPAYKGCISTASEIFEYISQSPNRIQIHKNGDLTLLDKKDSNGKAFAINITQLEKYKFEALWQNLSQTKKVLDKQINKNFEKDEKREIQFNEDIEGLKKMDAQIGVKIDALDKKLTKLCNTAVEASTSANTKVNALQQKQTLLQNTLRNLEQSIKSVANDSDNKLDDVRRQIQSIKSDLSLRMRNIQMKNVDLQSKIDKIDQTATVQYKSFEDTNIKISKDLQDLGQDTKDDIARLQKKIRELSTCHEKQENTISITTITNNYDSLRSGLEKLQKQTKEAQNGVNSTSKLLNDHIRDNKEQIKSLLETDLAIKKSIETIQVNIDTSKQNVRQIGQESKKAISGLKEQNKQIEKNMQEKVQKIQIQISKFEKESLDKLTCLLQFKQFSKTTFEVHKAKLDTLEAANTACKTHGQATQSRIDALEKITSAYKSTFEEQKAKLEELEQRSSFCKLNFQKIDSKIQSLQTTDDSFRELIDSIRNRIDMHEKQAKKVDQQLKSDLQLLEQDNIACKTNWQNIKARFDGIQNTLQDHKNKIESDKLRVDILEQANTACNAFQKEANSKFESLQASTKKLQENAEQSNKNIEILINSLNKEIKEKISDLEEASKACKIQGETNRSKIEVLEQKTPDYQSRFENINARIDLLEKANSQCRVNTQRIAGKIDALEKSSFNNNAQEIKKRLDDLNNKVPSKQINEEANDKKIPSEQIHQVDGIKNQISQLKVADRLLREYADLINKKVEGFEASINRIDKQTNDKVHALEQASITCKTNYQLVVSRCQQVERRCQDHQKPSQNDGSSIKWILRSLIEMKSELLPEQLDELALKYGHHPRNPHKEYFSAIKQDNVSLSINHISENSYYNFINRFEIAQGKQASYHLKLNKLTLQNLYIGFGTIGVFGSNQGSPQDGVYYYCGDGCIYSGKSIVKSGVISDTGDELTVEADLSKGRIVWKKNGAQFQECPVPEKMAGKSLYFIMRSYYQQDEVAIIF